MQELAEAPAAEPRHRVRSIDFRRPSKFIRDQVRRIEHAHRGFCRSASSRLTAELRTDVELAVSGTDQLPYTTVMADEVPQAALVAVLDVRPLGTRAALVLELPLVLRLVDRLLGGGPPIGEPEARDGLTDVEVAVARRALGSLLEPLSTTWLDLADLSFELAALSVSPMTVQIVPPSEPTLVLEVETRIDGVVSPVRLCVPHRSVAGVLDRVDAGDYGSAGADAIAGAAMEAAVGDVELELCAEVGAIDMTLDDVLRLRPGDVVPLGRPADQGVVLRVGDVATHLASPGRNRNRRAVQIQGRCEP